MAWPPPPTSKIPKSPKSKSRHLPFTPIHPHFLPLAHLFGVNPRSTMPPINEEVTEAAAALADLGLQGGGPADQPMPQLQTPEQFQMALDTAQQVIQDQQHQIQQQAAEYRRLQDDLRRSRQQPPNRRSLPSLPVLGKEHLSLIPDFSGDPDTLLHFLDITGKLFARFWNHQDPEDFQNVMLIAGVKSKIKPPASTTLLSVNLTTYDEIKQALLNAYADKRDIFSLNIDLTKLRQYDSETAFTFHTRVKTAFENISAYLHLHEGGLSHILIPHYASLALRVFLLHVKDPLGSALRSRQPADLNAALGIMTNELNVRKDPNLKPSAAASQQKHGPGPNRGQTPRQTFSPRPAAPPSNTPRYPQPAFFRAPFQHQPRPVGPQANPFTTPRSNQAPLQPRFAQPAQPRVPPPAGQRWKPMSWQTTNPNLNNVALVYSPEDGEGAAADPQDPTFWYYSPTSDQPQQTEQEPEQTGQNSEPLPDQNQSNVTDQPVDTLDTSNNDSTPFLDFQSLNMGYQT